MRKKILRNWFIKFYRWSEREKTNIILCLNDKDNIRRIYLQNGPCQPKNMIFQNKNLRFYWKSKDWIISFQNLKYTISKDALFYLYCYTVRLEIRNQKIDFRNLTYFISEILFFYHNIIYFIIYCDILFL